LIARACAVKLFAMSSSTTHTCAVKKRNYKLQKRAETREQTRHRILDAAVDLHCTIGPARTTVSQIAERAGVQRHTYYAHFPDERSLFLACSALALERGPLPEPADLRSIPAGGQRLEQGLKLFYDWFERNELHAACILRDATDHALTREMVELRIAPAFRKASEIMGEGLGGPSLALLGVALDFACWRKLRGICDNASAAALMTDAIVNLNSDASANVRR
jgi:AcrR family transcriptional regulator